MGYREDGVEVFVDLSTAGDLIPPQTTTAYPFLSSSGGIATGWTQYLASGAVATDANWTVTNNGQCISNALTTHWLTNAQYGIQRDFPAVANHRYVIGIDVRTMENKSPLIFEAHAWTLNAAGVVIREVNGYVLVYSESGWQKCQLFTEQLTINNGHSGVTGLRVLFKVWRNVGVDQINYGAQFSNAWITDVDVQGQTPLAWRDIHCDVKELAIRYGRSRFTERYDVASCSLVVDNTDGEYAYRDPHPFNLRPGRYVRVRAFYKSNLYPLYFGIIDSIVDGYGLDGRAITTFHLVDPSSLGANIPVPFMAGDPSNIGGAYMGARVMQLIGLIGYLTYAAVDAGVFGFQKIQSSGRTARDEIGLCADSENGLFFADRAGVLTYLDRNTRTYPTTSKQATAQIVAGPHSGTLPHWDNVPTTSDAPLIDPYTLQTDWSQSRVVNRVTLAVAGGNARQFDDAESQRSQGIKTYQRMDLICLEDSYGTATLPLLANDLMTGQSKPVLRFNSAAWRASAASITTPNDPWVFTFKVFLNWLVRLWYLNSRTGWGYVACVYVQSIEHRITIDEWETTIAVDQPVSFVSVQMSNRGWDIGLWGTDKWDDVSYG